MLLSEHMLSRWRDMHCRWLVPYIQNGTLEADSHIACRTTKGLECVFPIWFTQCGHVWFTLAMPCSDHAVLLKATAQHVCWERRLVGYLPVFGFFRLPCRVPRSCYQKHTNLRCRWPMWNQTTFGMDKEKSGSSTLQNRQSVTLLD
jgi:hypothetical protein